ncbi:MAG: hypothetical protein P1V81_15400 [Planctomycetota bacterium]|nr:hypothetical protein [Planctomycetota bacterium]
MPSLRVNNRTGLLCLVLVLLALLLAGPAHGLFHHDGPLGDQDLGGDDCQLCHVHVDTFAVVDLVPAVLEPAHLGALLSRQGPLGKPAERTASPRAPPLA